MLRAQHGLVLVVTALLVFGVVMVNSAGLSINADRAVDLQSVIFGRPTFLAFLAIVALLLGACVPTERLFAARGLASPVLWIMLASLLLLPLVYAPMIGNQVNGAHRWVQLGPIGFQPSEVVKWSLALGLAWYAARNAARMRRFGAGFLAPMSLVLLVCAFIGVEDLGTAVLICIVAACVLVAAGARIWHAMTLVPVLAAGFVAAVLISPYRINRLRAFLDPYADPEGIGYHIIQSMGAISGGGLAGRGLGNSIQKFGYLPEDTTDFIFAIICEELGVVGAAIVIFLYAALLLCGLSIIRQVKLPFQRLLGLGILLTIGLQAVINMAVVTGSAPTKGIALPLLSNGGTGWLLTAFSVGMLVSMGRALSRAESKAAGAAASDRGYTGASVPALSAS